jgi:hypothetical protein
MHLLTWVGFGLIGYIPNTLYNTINAPNTCNDYGKQTCYVYEGKIA